MGSMHAQSRRLPVSFLIVVLAVIGYVLWTMPHAAGGRVGQGGARSARGSATSTWPSSASAAAARRRCSISILLHIWKNTRQKSAERERRNLSPSEMSAAAQDAGVCRQSGGRPRIRGRRPCVAGTAGRNRGGRRRAGGEARVAAARDRRVRHDLQRQVVAAQRARRAAACFAPMWSAARPRRAAKFPGRRAIASCSSIRRAWPKCAAKRGPAESAAAAKNADLVLFVVDGPLKSYEASCSKRWPRWRSGSSSASTKKIGTTPTARRTAAADSASKWRRR